MADMSSDEHDAALHTQPVTGARKKTKRDAENAGLTEAQKERVKRAKSLQAIKKRYARHCERPIPSTEAKFLVEMVQFPLKRSAHPAYDDTSAKRRKVMTQRPKRLNANNPQAGKRPARRRTPWGGGPEVEQPPAASDMPVGSSLADPDREKGLNPITAMGWLGELPTEIRDGIMRYLLLWHEDIVVFAGWSRVYPRKRPRLQVSIMSTCQVLRLEGLRILFGENTFAYDLRDPLPRHKDTPIIMEEVFGRCVVPINEHGHLIRHVKIAVAANRVHTKEERQNFEKALLKFVPGNGLVHPANLHTVTFEIPARCQSDLGWSGPRVRPNHVPICDYFWKGSKLAEALFDFRIQWLHILAHDKHKVCWSTIYDLRYFFKDETMRLEYVDYVKTKKKLDDSAEERDSSNDQGPRPPHRPKDVKAMEDYWDLQVRRATGKLRNLAWRVEGLAVDPDNAIDKLGLWRPAPTAGKGRFNTSNNDELVSLPPDWRETSRSARRVPSGARKPAKRGKPNLKLGSNTSTKPKTDATKGGTTTRNNRAFPGILAKRGNRMAEMSLIQAQQSLQNGQMRTGNGGMLTEEGLENTVELGVGDME